MSSKHYNSNYLENTGEFLLNLKKRSYQGFTGVTSGKIVDLGCGTGIDAINLAKMLGTGVEVIGVDHDERLLAKAGADAKEVPNIRFVSTDAGRIPFEGNSIDGMRAERLVQHLQYPEQVIAEIHRVLKPGAPVVIVETVWDSLCFYTHHIAIEKMICRYLTDHKVNNGWAANYITNYLVTHRFREIHMESYQLVGRTLSDAHTYLYLGHILREMKEKEYLSAAEYEEFNNTLEAADKNGCFLCSMNLIIASAVK